MRTIVLRLLRDTASDAYQEMHLYLDDTADEIGASGLINWLEGVVSETTEPPLPYFPSDKTGEPVPHDDYVGELHDADGAVTRTAAAAAPDAE